MIKMKRAQGPSQMFVYIITLIVIGLMLYMSVKWIGGIQSTAKEIDVASLKSDLENSFESIKYKPYSMSTESFVIPDGINTVCFLDATFPQKMLRPICDPGNNSEFDPLMCNDWHDNQSVVFRPSDIVTRPIYLEDVRVGEGYLCFEVQQGKINVRLEGKGNAVKVTRLP